MCIISLLFWTFALKIHSSWRTEFSREPLSDKYLDSLVAKCSFIHFPQLFRCPSPHQLCLLFKRSNCARISLFCATVQEHCLMYLHCTPAWHIALHRNKTRQRLHRNEICRCMADLDQESYRDTTSGTEIQKNASKKGKYFSAPVPRASWPPSNASHIKNLCISDVNRSVTHRCLACILPGHTKLRFEKKAR